MVSKRLSNLGKHGVDMADVAEGFDVAGAKQCPACASRTGRARLGLSRLPEAMPELVAALKRGRATHACPPRIS